MTWALIFSRFLHNVPFIVTTHTSKVTTYVYEHKLGIGRLAPIPNGIPMHESPSEHPLISLRHPANVTPIQQILVSVNHHVCPILLPRQTHENQTVVSAVLHHLLLSFRHDKQTRNEEILRLQ